MDYLQKIEKINNQLTEAIDKHRYFYLSNKELHLEGPWTRTIKSLCEIFQKASPNWNYDLIANIKTIETVTNNALISFNNDLENVNKDDFLEKIKKVKDTTREISTKIKTLTERYHKSQGITSCKDLGDRIISRPKIAWFNPCNWGRYLRYSISFARLVYKTLTCYKNKHQEKIIPSATISEISENNWNKIQEYKNSLDLLKKDFPIETIEKIGLVKVEASKNNDILFNYYVALEKAYELTIPYDDTFFDFIKIKDCPKNLFSLAQEKILASQETEGEEHQKNRKTLKKILEKSVACKFFKKNFDSVLPTYIPNDLGSQINILKNIYENNPINDFMNKNQRAPNFDPKPFNNEIIENKEPPTIEINNDVKKEVNNDVKKEVNNDVKKEVNNDVKKDVKIKNKEDHDELTHESLDEVLKNSIPTSWQLNFQTFLNMGPVIKSEKYIKIVSTDLVIFKSKILNDKNCKSKKGIIVEIQKNEDSKTFWKNLLEVAKSEKIGVIYLMGDEITPSPPEEFFTIEQDNDDEEESESSEELKESDILKDKIVCSKPLYFEPKGDFGAVGFEQLKEVYPYLLVKPDQNGVIDCSKCNMDEFEVVMNTCFETNRNPLKIKFPNDISAKEFSNWIDSFQNEHGISFNESLEKGFEESNRHDKGEINPLSQSFKEKSVFDFSDCKELQDQFFKNLKELFKDNVTIIPTELKYKKNKILKTNDLLDLKNWLSLPTNEIPLNLPSYYSGLQEYVSVLLIPLAKLNLLTDKDYSPEWKILDPTSVSLWLYKESYKMMPQNSHIDEINCYQNRRLNDENVEEFLSKFPHVKKVCLTNTEVTNDKVNELKENYGNKIDFYYTADNDCYLSQTTVSQWLNNDQYKFIDNNEKITEIDARNNPLLTDYNIDDFLSKTPNVKTIELSGTKVSKEKADKLKINFSHKMDTYCLDKETITHFLENNQSLSDLTTSLLKQNCYLFAATFYPELLKDKKNVIPEFKNFELGFNEKKSRPVNRFKLNKINTHLIKKYFSFAGESYFVDKLTLKNEKWNDDLIDIFIYYVEKGQINTLIDTDKLNVENYIKYLKTLDGAINLFSGLCEIKPLLYNIFESLPSLLHPFLLELKKTEFINEEVCTKTLDFAKDMIRNMSLHQVHDHIDPFIQKIKLTFPEYESELSKFAKSGDEMFKNIF